MMVINSNVSTIHFKKTLSDFFKTLMGLGLICILVFITIVIVELFHKPEKSERMIQKEEFLKFQKEITLKLAKR